jgi:hypothetical protein
MVGVALTVTIVDAVAVQLLTLIVTVYVPDAAVVPVGMDGF